MRLSSIMKVVAGSWLAASSLVGSAAVQGEQPFKKVAYFAEWGIYGRNYEVADVPADQLTHMMYAFAVINNTTHECNIFDSWAATDVVFPAKNGLPAQNWAQSEKHEAGNFGRIKDLKKKYPHLKVLLSVGGWTKSSEFSDAATPEYREHFAQSCVNLMNQYRFDGLDLDWEYPVEGGLPGNVHRPEDKQNFTALLQSVKQKLKSNQELTIAVSADPGKVKNLEVAEINKVVDAIHLMTYDYHGGWNEFTAHHASLYAPDAAVVNGQEKEEGRLALNVNAGVQAYLNAGASPERLVLGMPSYGRAWMAPTHSEKNGLYEPATKQVVSSEPGNWEDGYFDYSAIQRMIKAGKVNAYFDSTAGAPYAYSPETGLFITYDSPESVRAKVRYLKSMHLGGAMFWVLDADVRDIKSPDSLLGTVNDELKQ
jgi:chitinase